ncbi:hypothetical protein QM042_02555 [Escherichia coli]|uniref:hypothetical protein n=1 Tax=Escherichia coli TaxID=562 RepID=UPI003986EA1E
MAAQKDKAVINMGDFSLIHVQPEFQAVPENTPTLLPDGFRLCFGAFDDEDKIIGIAAMRCWRPSPPVFSDRRTSAPLDTVIPVPPIFSGFPAQVALMQVLIELER